MNRLLEKLSSANAKYTHKLAMFTAVALILSACATSERLYRNDDYKMSVFYYADNTCKIFIDGNEVEADRQKHYGIGDRSVPHRYWDCIVPNWGDAYALVFILEDEDRDRFDRGEELSSGVSGSFGGDWLSKYEKKFRFRFLNSFGLRMYDYRFKRYDSGPHVAKLVGSARRYESFG